MEVNFHLCLHFQTQKKKNRICVFSFEKTQIGVNSDSHLLHKRSENVKEGENTTGIFIPPQLKSRLPNWSQVSEHITTCINLLICSKYCPTITYYQQISDTHSHQTAENKPTKPYQQLS